MNHTRRLVPLTERGVRFEFYPTDIDRLRSSTAMLNDVCINSTAALLQRLWSRPGDVSEDHSRRCAVFSTFDLLMARSEVPPRDMYRRTAKLDYWKKDIWILPIHRATPEKHWVMCVICIRSRELFLFDSLADSSPWKREISMCI
jgi:Ulp1 family protease